MITSPAPKKPCFSEEDFPPLGNNAKNSQIQATTITAPQPRDKNVQKNATVVKLVKGDATPVQIPVPEGKGPHVVVIPGGSNKGPNNNTNTTGPTTTKTPFQVLTDSINAVQSSMNDKMKALQQTVNTGIDAVKKLVTDPTCGVEPRIKVLEDLFNRKEPVIDRLQKTVERSGTGLVSRVAAMEESIKKLSTGSAASVYQPTDVELDEGTPELLRRLHAVELRSIGNENTLDVVVAWAGALERSQNAMKKQMQFNTSKHHTNDLLVGGIYEYKKQDCHKAALKFFRDKMRLTVGESDVIRAYRTGQPRKYKKQGVVITCPCQMVVKCSSRLRDLAMQNKKVLGGQVDSRGNFSYFVAQYLPEPFKAAREKYRPDVAAVLKANETRQPQDQQTVRVVGTELSVNNEIRPDPLYPPDIHQVIYGLRTQTRELSNMEFVSAYPVSENGSTFKGYGVRVKQLAAVELAYIKARQTVPNADHIMVAYKLGDLEGSCDDGECFGDLQIMKLIKKQKMNNVAIFVTRTKGETNLGSRRFEIIREVVSDVLQRLVAETEEPADPEWEEVPSAVETWGEAETDPTTEDMEATETVAKLLDAPRPIPPDRQENSVMVAQQDGPAEG